MLIAFILAQQRVTVEAWGGEEGSGGYRDGIERHLPFCFVTVCPRLASRCFSLIIETVKLFSFAAQDVSGQKGCHGWSFPLFPLAVRCPLSLFLSFFFFAFVCWFTRANYLYTILVVRHMCRGCFACTPRHDRGGTEFAPKTRRQPQEFLVLFVFAWYCLDAAPLGVVLAGYPSWLEEHPLVPLPVA